MYRGQWRFISVSDVPCYVLGVFGGAVFSLASVTLITRFPHGHSRSAYIIFALLVFVAIVGSRLSFRLLDSVFAHNHSDAGPNGRKLVLIYGAARAGKILHDEITSNPELRGYSIIGFIDNDHHLNGRRLCGIPIRSESEWLGQAWHCVPEIWISSKFISDQQGQALAQNWSGLVTVRRVQLHMETIEHAQEQAGPCVVKAIDRDREIFHANSDTVALHTVSQVAHESPITEHA
jgi:FlaA1/EpsC-like NDP-sugar epimerase